MSKQIILEIPSPCSEKWANMQPSAKGKYCAQCQKEVIDFSTKTDAEIFLFFEQQKEGTSVCGRITPQQANRPIIAANTKPSFKFPFAAMLTAGFAAFSLDASGQNTANPTSILPSKAQTDNSKTPPPKTKNRLAGIVIDTANMPVKGIEIYIAYTRLKATTDANGAFEISIPDSILTHFIVQKKDFFLYGNGILDFFTSPTVNPENLEYKIYHPTLPMTADITMGGAICIERREGISIKLSEALKPTFWQKVKKIFKKKR
jgi:hypothetical protein